MKIFNPKNNNLMVKNDWMKSVTQKAVKHKSPQPKFAPTFLGFENFVTSKNEIK